VQGGQISPLFHEDGQDAQVINLTILPRGGWCPGCGGEAGLAGGSFQRRALEMVGGMAGQIKVPEMRRKRYNSPSHVLIAGPSPIGVVLLRRCGDERDGLLPTRYVFGTSRMSSGLRVPWLGIAAGWCPVRLFFRIVKDASSRGRTGRTLFRHCDSRSPQARPRGALHG
jgi:hypothetical protein